MTKVLCRLQIGKERDENKERDARSIHSIRKVAADEEEENKEEENEEEEKKQISQAKPVHKIDRPHCLLFWSFISRKRTATLVPKVVVFTSISNKIIL